MDTIKWKPLTRRGHLPPADRVLVRVATTIATMTNYYQRVTYDDMVDVRESVEQYMRYCDDMLVIVIGDATSTKPSSIVGAFATES